MADPNTERAHRERLYRQSMAAYGADDVFRHDPQAIVECVLCNADGYRGSAVCDHIDHAGAALRGMAMIRAAMGWTTP